MPNGLKLSCSSIDGIIHGVSYAPALHAHGAVLGTALQDHEAGEAPKRTLNNFQAAPLTRAEDGAGGVQKQKAGCSPAFCIKMRFFATLRMTSH